jgi:hypothetical protein
MAQPNFELVNGDTFTFSNEHLTIAVDTNFPQDPITVESVAITIENPRRQDTLELPITDFVVPPPVVDHVFDLFDI